jgi:peroxiredoxin Q/BCP
MRTLLPLTLLASAFLLGGAMADEKTGPEIGARAPDFRLNDHEGKARALGELRGDRWLVLAFYPKAHTGGCTKEVCSLRDSLKDLEAIGVAVCGISLDDVGSQRSFHEAQKLNFPLLSDPDGSVAAKYAAMLEGKPYSARVTFVIDDKGVLRHADRKVSVESHGRDLAGIVRGLRGP